MTNVVATLQGTDPTAASRVYVVSAHYDDRVTDVFDFTDDAPGADEDASGVAALLEFARVMAAHPAKATIEFALFDGEEQGLYGSSFFASQSKAAGREHPGRSEHGHHRQLRGRQRRCGLRTRCGCTRRACRPPRTATQITTIQQTVGGENDSASRAAGALHRGDGPEQRDANERRPGVATSTASCAAAIRSRSTGRASRRCGTPRRTRTSTTTTRTSPFRTASSSAICRSS